MAKNVTVQVLGGQPKVVEADTVAEAMEAAGLSGTYTSTVNGDPASMDTDLDDYEFVSFSPAVKGGC